MPINSFSRRLQQWCSYSGTAGRDDFWWGSLLRIIFIGIPYIFIGTVYFSDLGFQAETLQGALALSIWMIPYQLLFSFPLAMRRWRDLNGKLHARWLLVYFIYCILPNISDLTENQYGNLVGRIIQLIMLYPAIILLFARGDKSKRIYRDKLSDSANIVETTNDKIE